MLAFRREGKTGVPGEKPLGAEWRTNKLSPYHAAPGNRTRVTLVEGECFYFGCSQSSGRPKT